jgi:hypothetical protein
MSFFMVLINEIPLKQLSPMNGNLITAYYTRTLHSVYYTKGYNYINACILLLYAGV